MQTLAYEKFKCLDKDECYIFYLFIFFMFTHTTWRKLFCLHVPGQLCSTKGNLEMVS